MGAFSPLSTILFNICIVYLLLSFDSSLIEAKKGKGGGGTVVVVNEQQAGGGQPVMYCCGSAIGCSDQVCTDGPKEDSPQCNSHLWRKECRPR